MNYFQLDHRPIACPEKLLISAVIRCAMSDARGMNSLTNEQDVYSAHEFLTSGTFTDLCDWLGVQPRIRDQAIAEAIRSEGSPGLRK